jgi:amidase
VERTAAAAKADAACLAGARAAGARLVGKTNLHELAMLPVGTNPWFGTPVNPLDPERIPGGSSSGSAVALATDEADLALGSDTGGSIRVPSACCGVAGLKTTYGRVPLGGVWPLAPSLDTIGPMATSVTGLVGGMELLEPGFAAAESAAQTVGRLRTSALPAIEGAVDDALRSAELDVVSLDWEGFDVGTNCFTTVFFNEIWETDHELVEQNPDSVGEDIVQTIGMVELFRAGLDEVRQQLAELRRSLALLFDQVELLALPTLPIFPPRLEDITGDAFVATVIEITRYVSLFNALGLPCTAQPVPARSSHLPASLQLVGPSGTEELLLTTAQRIENASS